MPEFSDLIPRCEQYLQDEDNAAWSPSQILLELNDAISELARKRIFSEVLWMQAVENKEIYPLNEQSIFIQSGTDDSAGSDDLTTITDSSETFTTNVVVGDRVRNLTDGSIGTITTVNATTLVCADGFAGGQENAVDDGDLYIVERPLTASSVVSVESVLYNGYELNFATEDSLDRLRPAWELGQYDPAYWSLDNLETPSVIRVSPAPLFSGSSVPRFPALPLAMQWENNLVAFVTVQPQQAIDMSETIHITEPFHDPIVFKAVERLVGHEGEWQNPSLALTMKALAQLWEQSLEVSP